MGFTSCSFQDGLHIAGAKKAVKFAVEGDGMLQPIIVQPY